MDTQEAERCAFTGTMGSTVKTAGVTWLNGDVWRDGDTPPAGATMLHDRGFVLGDGLFETLLVRRKLPVLWGAHIDRILSGGNANVVELESAME